MSDIEEHKSAERQMSELVAIIVQEYSTALALRPQLNGKQRISRGDRAFRPF